jgi:hypothetical protein
MVQGERAIGARVAASRGGSWTGPLFGDLFEALYELMEAIYMQGQVRGGAEHIASCRCSW